MYMRKEASEMNMRFWAKSLVMLCIGFSIGSIGINIWKGKWTALPGWIAACAYAAGWRMEMSLKDDEASSARYWRKVANDKLNESRKRHSHMPGGEVY